MKKLIVGIEKDWIAALFGVIGALLILFPQRLTNIVLLLLGVGLLLHGFVSLFVFFRYSDSGVKPGKIILYLVLGAAILHHSADAIGPIGAIWAMVSLNEIVDEVNEAVEKERFSLFNVIISVISIVLAVMLLFDPFEHFATHVRILGLEMIASVLVRRHNILRK